MISSKSSSTRSGFCFSFVFTFFVLLGQVAFSEALHGPNVNPSNLAVLVEWEKFTGQQAGIIGDNFSADSWEVFQEASSYREKNPKGAIAEQLRRWGQAFDGNGVLESSEGSTPYQGSPRGALSDYVLELAIPIFPSRLANEDGELVDSSTVPDRWGMGAEGSRHYQDARRAFRSLATALVDNGMKDARLRLGWEFSGDWFPWGIDPNGGARAGTPEQFKACWKFVYLTMEEVNPRFTWVWSSHTGYDHFDPSAAFPEYPKDSFPDAEDQKDKTLVDFVSVDVYDADGDCYFRPDDPSKDNYELIPGYWNHHPKELQDAYTHFAQKIFEGKGHHAAEGESAIYGLRFFKNLADEKRLPFVLSEWGPWANWIPVRGSKTGKMLRSIAFGGDDNPLFIDGLFKWVTENEVNAAVLFEFYDGGAGDRVDHTLLPRFWNTPQEGRPRVSLYPENSPYFQIKDQLHPRAAEAYLRNLKGN